MCARRSCDQEVTAQVDFHDRVPVFYRHVEDHLVAEDPRVVDHDVEPSPRAQGLADERVGARWFGDVLEVRDGLAAGGPDLFDHLGGRPGVGSRSVPLPTQVVHYHPGPFLGEQERLASADASPRTGDDRDLPVERAHGVQPPVLDGSADRNAT